VPAKIESSGDIEVLCDTHELGPNKTARLVFRLVRVDLSPPFQLRVRAPSGQLILERVIRELPTGEPQAAPPVTFTVRQGEYRIEIAQLRGGAGGHATLTVT
jgi:hypothetical protein